MYEERKRHFAEMENVSRTISELDADHQKTKKSLEELEKKNEKDCKTLVDMRSEVMEVAESEKRLRESENLLKQKLKSVVLQGREEMGNLVTVLLNSVFLFPRQ
jgi:hypothetical protein